MSVNLLPWREARHQQKKKRLLYCCVLGLVIVIVSVVFWQVRNHTQLANQSVTLRLLQQRLLAISKDYTSAAEIQKKQQKIAQQQIFLKQQLASNQRLFAVLAHLGDNMPENIYLTSLHKKEVMLFFNGKSPSHLELATFLQRLTQLMQSQPVVTETTHDDDQEGAIEFSIGYEVGK